jgi:hypothetical protein
MNKEEKDIVEGFNAGYVIRSNEPELYNQLNDSLKDSKSNYFNSFLEGAETYEQQKAMELLKSGIKPMDHKAPSKDNLDLDIEV